MLSIHLELFAVQGMLGFVDPGSYYLGQHGKLHLNNVGKAAALGSSSKLHGRFRKLGFGA